MNIDLSIKFCRSYVEFEKEKRAKLVAQSTSNEKEEVADVDIKDNAELKNKGRSCDQ